MKNYIVQRVYDIDVQDVLPLVFESERVGLRFVRRFYEDYTSGTNRFDHHGEALFIAKLSNQIVGICGLNQDPYIQDGNVGRVRRLFVHPDFRKQGIGKELVFNVIEEARQFYEILILRTDNSTADQFYRAMGFSTGCLYENTTHCFFLI